MKKLIAVLAVLMFAVPAFAADWSFYGSQRIGTWYTEREYPGDSTRTAGTTTRPPRCTSRATAAWAPRSRPTRSPARSSWRLGAGGDGGDTSVATRRAYGMWKFSDNGGLKIGKDYSPVTDFISNQWYSADTDLLGEGNFYGRRPGGLTLILGDFELAALVPSYGADINAPPPPASTVSLATPTRIPTSRGSRPPTT